MPVSYRIDEAGKIIRTVCTSPMSVADAAAHFRELSDDPACTGTMDVLLNVTAVDALPDSRELSAVSQELWTIGQKIKFGICAIVAGRDAMFGMMRMFEVFAQRCFVAIRVFRDADEAEVWLVSQRQKLDTENKSGGSVV
jgi:hypothetical protein